MKTSPCQDCLVFSICRQRIYRVLGMMHDDRAYVNLFKDYYRAKHQAIVSLCTSCGIVVSYIYQTTTPAVPSSINAKLDETAKLFNVREIWESIDNQSKEYINDVF